MISNLLLLALIVGLHGFWIYKLTTYDWSNFEEDQKQAMKDFF